MYYSMKSGAAFVALIAMAACGGATTGDMEPIGSGGSGGVSFSGADPSISEGNLDSRNRSYISALKHRVTGTLPAGNATYKGYVQAPFSGNNTALADTFHGTINVSADLNFSGDDFDGSISNLHVSKDGVPVEKLSGSIAIGGSANDREGSAYGQFTSNEVRGQINGTEVADFEITGFMNGDFRDRVDGKNLIGPTYDKASVITGTAEVVLTSQAEDGSDNWAPDALWYVVKK